MSYPDELDVWCSVAVDNPLLIVWSTSLPSLLILVYEQHCMLAGYIEFVVEPCYQIMGDVLEAVIKLLVRYNHIPVGLLPEGEAHLTSHPPPHPPPGAWALYY